MAERNFAFRGTPPLPAVAALPYAAALSDGDGASFHIFWDCDMRKHLLGLVLIAGMAGCTSEPEVGPASGTRDVPAQLGRAPMPSADSLAAARGSTSNFAALPDRGELLAYGGVRKVRTSGAYTWHPVAISEAHALNAIGTGRMVLALPGGEAVSLEYQRHEEQPDGNWTWIGTREDGTSAVLTFGEKAVFGSIARDGKQYRIRTDRTGAWVVETDPRLVAADGGRPADGNDTLMPPEGRALMAAASRQAAKSDAAGAPVPGKAGGIIDLLIGYSSTIASELGSQNAAVTLMSNLAAIANTAYANSGVNMRIRLVHAMPVNYADATPNRDALRQLTGYNDETQQRITPNASFNALRAARDQYGADLVAFVRRYREPEQDGCGVAWLLGRNQSSIIAADEEFGYAVVSDGEDPGNDNNVYFCSDFSLAHELGHLMGQAHNRENAQDGGAHTYSYGYREASPSGFFTIMAYPSGDGQSEAPVFASPAVQYAGRPAGTATEDNVRSMNQTMPIVAAFRARVVPVQGADSDFNGDGFSDILWRNASNGRNIIWRSGNGSAQTELGLVSDQNWQVVGDGDFNADGISDILWRNASTGQNTIWRGGDVGAQTGVMTVTDLSWRVVGVGDFNGDGASDILWRNAANGRNVIWRSGNGAAQTDPGTVSDLSWQVVGVGDFNGDGVSDILWRHATTGQNTIWRGGSINSQTAVMTVSDLSWRVVGVGDFNGDGLADILWRNVANGRNVIWRAGNGGAQIDPGTVSDLSWQVAGVADYNGDGVSDILWRHAANGANVIWLAGSISNQAGVMTVADAAWRVMPPS